MESYASLKEPLAVFDVDGTLFRRGLMPALTRRLVNEEVFPERVREELSEDYYAWVERRGSYEIYDELVVQLFLRELKGVSVAELRRCAKVEVEAHVRRKAATPGSCSTTPSPISEGCLKGFWRRQA